LTLSSGDDAIHADDSVEINGGKITVAKSFEGIEGAAFTISDGIISINSGDDGVDTAGTLVITKGVIKIKSGGDAIQAADVLITGGSFDIISGGGSLSNVSADFSAKGVKATVSLTINDGDFVINSADDAVHSDGTITINGGSLVLSTGDDGIHADSSIIINNGYIKITKSYEGVEAPIIIINGGNTHVVSSDDGVNIGVDLRVIPPPSQPGTRLSVYSGTDYLYINGGYLFVNALGDGIDSNGAVIMNGGVVIVDGPSSDRASALDHVAFNITNGYLAAVGSSFMAMPLGELSTQYSVMMNFQTAIQAGTLICVRESNGDEVFTFQPTKQYQSIVFSMPSLSLGHAYDVYIGGSHTGTIKDGLYSGGTYTPGTEVTSFTINSTVTQLGPPSGFFLRPPLWPP
jgi:hypothetical protein